MVQTRRHSRGMHLLAGRIVSAIVLLALGAGGIALLRGVAGSPVGATSHVAMADSRGETAAGEAPRAARGPGRAFVASPRLTTAQLAGQRIIYAYAGLMPPPSLLAAIGAGEAAGVIFFANNVAGSAQLRRVIGRLQRLARAAPGHRPLLMLTDQEGGDVRRLPGPPYSSEKQIGASPSRLALARAAGSGAARALTAVGLNVNLAPVLDIYRQAGNFIDQYGRSYSARPAVVSALGARFIAAQQAARIAATAKHFPGLGAATTAQNTDLHPVSLATSVGTLRTVDEAPYRSAIASGVKLVMISWARYPALDPRPAGLSPTVIGGELRGRLGFQGVTITDGIDAGALAGFGGPAHRAVLAARAGADLILCAATVPSNNSPEIGLIARDAIAAAISHRRLSRAAARRAAARVLALRARP